MGALAVTKALGYALTRRAAPRRAQRVSDRSEVCDRHNHLERAIRPIDALRQYRRYVAVCCHERQQHVRSRLLNTG
jgi:hypothetical protein